jgi:hypothetical protein
MSGEDAFVAGAYERSEEQQVRLDEHVGDENEENIVANRTCPVCLIEDYQGKLVHGPCSRLHVVCLPCWKTIFRQEESTEQDRNVVPATDDSSLAMTEVRPCPFCRAEFFYLDLKFQQTEASICGTGDSWQTSPLLGSVYYTSVVGGSFHFPAMEESEAMPYYKREALGVSLFQDVLYHVPTRTFSGRLVLSGGGGLRFILQFAEDFKKVERGHVSTVPDPLDGVWVTFALNQTSAESLLDTFVPIHVSNSCYAVDEQYIILCSDEERNTINAVDAETHNVLMVAVWDWSLRPSGPREADLLAWFAPDSVHEDATRIAVWGRLSIDTLSDNIYPFRNGIELRRELPLGSIINHPAHSPPRADNA